MNKEVIWGIVKQGIQETDWKSLGVSILFGAIVATIVVLFVLEAVR